MLLDNLDKFKNRVEILFSPKLNQIGIFEENAKKDGEENKLILLFANKDEAEKENESNSIQNNEIKEEEKNSSYNEIKNEIRVNAHAPGEQVKKMFN